MNNLLKELAADPSCILALFPDNGGEWCSPIHTPQPRDFTKEYHWDKLHTALQSLPWENDYHFEFKFTVHDFDTGSHWIMYQSAGRIVFSIGKDARGCRFVFGSYSFTDSAPIYTSFVPSLTGEHVVTVAVVGSTFKVTVDGTTYEKSGERVASSEYDRTIMTVAPVSIHSVALTDDTVSNVLWTAGYDELYDTNIPIPSSVPRNFAEEPEAWRDEKTTAPAIEEDDCEFFIRYRLDGYLEGSVISEIFYHNSQNGSINIAFAGNGTGGNYSVIRLTGAGAFVIPLDRVRQLGEHTIRIQRIGQTVTVEFDGEIVATSTGAEKVAVYSTTAPVSDFDGVIFETYWKNLTTGRTVWSYPSEAERVRLITKTNVRTDRGAFEAADETQPARVDTALDLRGKVSSYTVVVDFDAANFGGLNSQKQELAGQGPSISSGNYNPICSLAYGGFPGGVLQLSQEINGLRVPMTRNIPILSGRHVAAATVEVNPAANNTTLSVYLDGVRVLTPGVYAGIPTGISTWTNFAINDNRSGAMTNQFGKIHSCLLFDRALSAEEIALYSKIANS